MFVVLRSVVKVATSLPLCNELHQGFKLPTFEVSKGETSGKSCSHILSLPPQGIDCLWLLPTKESWPGNIT